MRSVHIFCIAYMVLMPLVLACGAPASAPVQSGPPTEKAQKPQPADETQPTPAGPIDVSIGELSLDADRTVRIKGLITKIVGMRMVPAQVIFKASDNTGTVTAVIMEQVALSEGTRLELVGVYKQVPSPMYSGPGEAPLEDVFVVERYLDLP